MNKLEIFCSKIRIETCKTIIHAGGGHLGGAMSIVEVLAVLYGKHMKIDCNNPKWEDRDWFILSKGHCGPAYYAALSLAGFFEKEMLLTLNKDNTRLPSHPDSLKTPGVDCTTGSLGQGISQAVGVAIALKHRKKTNKVYCIVGDGESNEGQVWEACQFAVGHELDNLIVFIDDNKKQLDGYTKDVNIEMNFSNIMEAFGFYTQVVKGDNLSEIDLAIKNAKRTHGVPSLIILDTIKGQGLSCIEQMTNNHHVVITEAIKEEIMKELHMIEEQL